MKMLFIKQTFRILIFIGIGLSFYSCAAIISGANQNIKIKSNPLGANVYINGQNTFMQTPCKVKVERRQKKPLHFRKSNNIEIEVKKEGYQDSKLIVNSSFNVVSVPSIFMAGLPFIADLIVGAHLRYPRNNFLAMTPVQNKITPPLRPMDEITEQTLPFEPSILSEIDTNIPDLRKKHPNKFALIIGNENYANGFNNLSNEVDVNFALNDAKIFKKYAEKTLCIPSQNIILLTNATLAQMQKGINKLNLLAKTFGPEAELYFYYAGHGLPHEETRDAYLLPVDLSGNDIDLAIKLDDVYANLSEHPTKKITCVLDCCFSGGARNKELVNARGVKIVPKANPISGNMVVFAASSGDQTAHAYNQKQHGLFTFFLLKKLQEQDGNVTLGEMQHFLKKEVAIQSILLNDKPQYPQTIVSPQVLNIWQNWKF